MLGRYRPLRPLGSGGSGSVWLAHDEETGADVALKIVPRDGKAGSRAEREVTAAARLRHERCQRAHALAEDDEHVYIAYEYFPGRNMRQALRAGELDDAAALEAAAQVLDALAHAHAHGVVHRDVKPSNVLLVDGPDVSVRLLDFGLAQLEEADTLTAAGDVPGTLAYISPERLRGEKSGPPSDVWAVGVMLWEALAGWHPFWASSLISTAKKIRAGAPALRDARPDLPGPLAAVVDSALERDPARRPSAAALATALRRAAPRRRARQPETALPLPSKPALAPITSKLPAAALAAVAAGWSASVLPFYPAGWAAGLAAVAAIATLVSAPAGLALALAVPVFPLGNVSLGLAVLYAVLAAAWFLVHARRGRAGLAFVAGPLLIPLGAHAVLPLAVQRAGGAVARAVHCAAGVVVAAAVSALPGGLEPSGRPPRAVAPLVGNESPLEVAGVLRDLLAAQPALLAQAGGLAAVAALLPFARRWGNYGVAGVALALLAAVVLPGVEGLRLLVSLLAWGVFLALVLRSEAPAGRDRAER